MNEKQFEHIENKIREAAKNTQVDFDKSSWVKMEALLDKKEDRKPFVWLCLLLPIILFSGYGINAWTKNNNEPNKNYSKKNNNITQATKANIDNKENEITITNNTNTEKIKDAFENNSSINKINNIETKIENQEIEINKNEISKNEKNSLIKNKNSKSLTPTTLENTDEIGNNTSKIKKEKAITKTTITNSDAVADNAENIKDSSIAKNNTVLKNELKKDLSNGVVKIKYKEENKILSKFYILGSLGGDIGSIKLFSFGKSSVAAKYGLGLGYELSKKLSVQSGFYISNKKYSAGAGYYQTKPGNYLNNLNINKVDALCLIYEIPVAFRYNFLNKKSLQYYATLGASSYIMKKENYDYFYNRYNMSLVRNHTYFGNTHLFSNAIASIGIEKRIANHFNLQIEPSFSIPLKGVGEGSVKLYSTALHIGLKYKPFKK
jgi:hypothetical protein